MVAIVPFVDGLPEAESDSNQSKRLLDMSSPMVKDAGRLVQLYARRSLGANPKG